MVEGWSSVLMCNTVDLRIVTFNQVFCHCPDAPLPLGQPGRSGKGATADPNKKPKSEGFTLSSSDENVFTQQLLKQKAV